MGAVSYTSARRLRIVARNDRAATLKELIAESGIPLSGFDLVPKPEQKQPLRLPARSVKRHERTHVLQQGRGGLQIAWSDMQLIEQRLRLFQIARVEAFGKPVVDRG